MTRLYSRRATTDSDSVDAVDECTCDEDLAVAVDLLVGLLYSPGFASPRSLL